MNLLQDVGRYWHTLRYLKPIQFYGRLAFRLARPSPGLAPAPPRASLGGTWVAPARRRASLLTPTTFDFLGVQGDLAEFGWDSPSQEKLWRYNQHYFDDLNAKGASQRSAWHLQLVNDWVAQNRPGQGSGWEPYPISLRIVNWAKWLWAGNELPASCVHSLAIQARFLTRRLEWHLLGNHLFANAKALVFAGLLFEGNEAEGWLAQGLGIIARQLPEQVLPDGGNFERSPMYHAIFLEDMLDLVNASRAAGTRIDPVRVEQWQASAAGMLTWLEGMTHPDGGISLFNDAALNIAPATAELQQYAARLGVDDGLARRRAPVVPDIRTWPDSGYVRIDALHASAFLDVGPIGPDYLPGHAHADTLSCELSLFGQRLLVNGGTSRYGLGQERLRERETKSHSTVEVDDVSSSEVWGGFRVARRAYPFDFSAIASAQSITVACSHDGYKRLPGKPLHRRTWAIRNGQLDIVDSVVGKYRSAKARYILHPDVQICNVSEKHCIFTLPGGETAHFEVIAGTGRLEQTWYAPEFGTVRETACIVVDLHDQAAKISIKWS